jgi:hypothetical protein
MQDLPLQGTLPEIFLPRLIARLHRERFEGVLRLTADDSTRILYFRDGEIASAASNAESDRLANILIRDGRLTPEQLDLARSRVEPGGSVGKALIDMGFLSPGELLQGARRQVRDILASCFAARAGAFQVEPGPLPPEVTSLGIPTRRLLFDCIVEAGDRDLVVREMGSMESAYRPTDDLLPSLQGLRLDPEPDRLARTLDGLLTLRDLSGRTRLDDFTVSKIVLALDVLGMVERVDAPAPAPGPPGRAIAIETEPADRGPAIPEEAAILGRAAPAAGDAMEDDAAAPEDEPILLEIEEVPEGDAAAPAAGGPAEGRAAAGLPAAGLPAEAIPDPDDPATRRSRIEVTPPAAPEPEPPAIPAEELPAFARPATEPRWEVDPETGERVHVGPVEVTFDGRVAAEEATGPGRTRLFLAAAGIVLVLGAAAAFILVRREARTTVAARVTGRPPAEAAAEPSPPPADATGGTAVAPEPGTPGTVTPGPVAPERVGPEPIGRAPAAGGPGGSAPAGPAPEPPEAARQPIEVPPEPAAVPRPPPSTPEEGPFPADRVAAAFRALEGGDAGGGARIFQEHVQAQSPEKVTLQVMIACQEVTLRNARARSGDGPLFFLPYAYQGRNCFRVCWGVYPDATAAAAAISSVPGTLLGPGGRPVPVPLARLRAGS